jgi:RimJ/RimL family protein N-acetyltransferase
MLIANSTAADINTIFHLYDEAVKFQKTVFNKQWQGFERDLIETEIAENRQWKIVSGGEVACIFAITFNDPLIWKEKDKDAAIYIHRIVTNPQFRGGGYVREIVKWAKEYAKNMGKNFVRMDTWGDNEKLRDYYISCGFEYLGITEMKNTEGLPKHYQDLSLSLFEIEVKVIC